MFWRRPYEDLTTPREARAKNVNKKSLPTGRNCENKAISLANASPPPSMQLSHIFALVDPFEAFFELAPEVKIDAE